MNVSRPSPVKGKTCNLEIRGPQATSSLVSRGRHGRNVGLAHTAHSRLIIEGTGLPQNPRYCSWEMRGL